MILECLIEEFSLLQIYVACKVIVIFAWRIYMTFASAFEFVVE